MQLNIFEHADQSGLEAARACEAILHDIIAKKGCARIVLSTGASQFEFLSHFVEMNVEWDKVEMFHLNEYIGLSESPSNELPQIPEGTLPEICECRQGLVN